MSHRELEIAVRDWDRVDGALDNTAAVDRIEGTEESALVDARCQRIRAVGWEASRRHDLAGQGPVGWPPNDSTLVISLDRDDRRFVLQQVRRWGTWERDSDPAALFEHRLARRVTSL